MPRRATKKGPANGPNRFGPLEAAHLEFLGETLREWPGLAAELQAELAKPNGPLGKLLDQHGRYWWLFYERPVHEALAALVVIQGWSAEIAGLQGNPNPNAAFLALALDQESREVTQRFDELDRPLQALFVNVLLSLAYTIEAVAHYGVRMDELLHKANSGVRGALGKAASIDRMVLVTGTAASIVAKAQTEMNSKFIDRAMNRKRPSLKGKSHLMARYMARVLVDITPQGQTLAVSDTQLVELFCHRLDMYAYSAGAGKAIRELIRRVRMESTTQD